MGTTKSFSWFIWLKYVGKICPVWPGNVILDLVWSRVNEIIETEVVRPDWIEKFKEFWQDELKKPEATQQMK